MGFKTFKMFCVLFSFSFSRESDFIPKNYFKCFIKKHELGDGDADRQNEINALTIRYNNRMRKQRPERTVVKTNA